jgi:hypothetical protein
METNMLELFFGTALNLMLMQPPPVMPLYRLGHGRLIPLPRDGARVEMVTHNGSLMALSVWPDLRIEIAYSQPKPELYAIGVRPGTLLVRGRWREDRSFAGVAHVFYCGALPYTVSGKVDETGALVMQGPAPRVWAGSCTVADYVWTDNSYLRFERLPEARPHER